LSQIAKPSRKWAALLSVILVAAILLRPLQPVQPAKETTIAKYESIRSDPPYEPPSRLATPMTMPPVKPPLLKTRATLCHRRVREEFFKSQTEEDKYLLETWFQNLCGGSYIEMGALDGVWFSNSYVFSKLLEWKGVLIEADPISYEKLRKNRRHEIARIHAGVCLDEKDLHWVQVKHTPPVSGFLEFASEDFKKTWWNKELIDNALPVKCRRLDTLLHEAVGKPYHFDFFSLDVEGAELLALQSLNFDEYQFGVIFVEADGSNARKDQGIKTLLARAGYDFVGNIKRSTWFVNRNFDLIYSDVIHDNKKK